MRVLFGVFGCGDPQPPKVELLGLAYAMVFAGNGRHHLDTACYRTESIGTQ
jgi:hypothetical protein